MRPRRRAAWVLAVALVAVGLLGLAWVGSPRPRHVVWARHLPPWRPELPNANAWDLYTQAGRTLQPEQSDSTLADGAPHPALRFDGGSFAAAVSSGDETLVRRWRPLMAACVASDHAALDQLRRGRGMQCIWPPAALGQAREDFTVYSELRAVATVEVGRAALLRLDGRDTEALDVLEDTFAMGTGVIRGGDVVTALFGRSVSAIACRAGTELLSQQPAVSKDRLLRHADVLRELREQLWPLASTMRVDGDAQLRMLEEMASDPEAMARKDRRADADSEPDDESLGARLRYRFREAAAWRDLPRILPWLDAYYVRLLPLLERPLWEIDATDLYARARVEGERMRVDGETTAANQIVNVASLVDQEQQHVSVLLAEELAARLAAYRLDHGEYPETLDALVPAYAESIPPDPWTGKAPLYRREGPTDYVLYCTGPDRKDDGGLGNPRGVNAPDRVLINTAWRPSKSP